MPFLAHLGRVCARLNLALGETAKWLTLAMVVVQFFIVMLRYVFGIGSIQMQEAIIYMHGILFLMAAAATWSADAHVRVDIIYADLTPPQKSMVNKFGTVFFVIPLAVLILAVSYDYVAMSWSVREGSRETSGIKGIFLLKTMILVFAGQLIAQALAILFAADDTGQRAPDATMPANGKRA